MHALHNIHAALVSDAVLVDTQPVSDRPPVTAGGLQLGTLDMREWSETIRAVDRLIASTVAAGLYEPGHEERFTVTDTFDTGLEAVETVGDWCGTRVKPALASQARSAKGPVTLRQEVRLRLFRRSAGDVPAPV